MKINLESVTRNYQLPYAAGPSWFGLHFLNAVIYGFNLDCNEWYSLGYVT